MEIHLASTPFGSRPISLARLAAHRKVQENRSTRTVDKWKLYRAICEARKALGIGDRSLAVLNALLSFYPHDELAPNQGLVVFPSNRQLSLRAHGMADATLRRHLAALVECGLIHRRDSPNGKRYAHKNRSGKVEEAFGFSLAPLLARCDELERAAESLRTDMIELKRFREQITLHRRDLSKLLEAAAQHQPDEQLQSLHVQFRELVSTIPRRADRAQLRDLAHQFARLRAEADIYLLSLDKFEQMSGNDCYDERQHKESHTESISDSESDRIKQTSTNCDDLRPALPPRYTVDLVLRTCPSILDYSARGIAGWSDLVTTAAHVGRFLGITPSTYADAVQSMGSEITAIVISCILQRHEQITNPGGYLRIIAARARAGQFSPAQILVATSKTTLLRAKATSGLSSADPEVQIRPDNKPIRGADVQEQPNGRTRRRPRPPCDPNPTAGPVEGSPHHQCEENTRAANLPGTQCGHGPRVSRSDRSG